MISDGSGTHIDSIAIKSATPTYPEPEMVAMIKEARTASIFSVILVEYTCPASNLYASTPKPMRTQSRCRPSHHRSQPLRRQTGLRRRLPFRCFRHAANHRPRSRHVARSAAQGTQARRQVAGIYRKTGSLSRLQFMRRSLPGRRYSVDS